MNKRISNVEHSAQFILGFGIIRNKLSPTETEWVVIVPFYVVVWEYTKKGIAV